MQKLISSLKFIGSPIFIGAIITLLMTGLARNFYQNRIEVNPERFDFILRQFKSLDEKSFDLRLQSRGIRPGSPDIALLTVDEKAVQEVGRWPWPRDRTAAAIAKAVELGAKVIAFDMVFSESSENSAQKIFEELKASSLLPSSVQPVIAEKLISHDADRAFNKMLVNNADHLVLGSFYENVNRALTEAGYPNACHDLIFKSSKDFSIWDQEEYLIEVADKFLVNIPYTLAEIYSDHLKNMATNIAASFNKDKKHLSELARQVQLENLIYNEQLNYCGRWLSKDDEVSPAIAENWQIIQQAETELADLSFDDWKEQFKNKYLTNVIPVSEHWGLNIPALGQGSKHTGYFNAVLDSDGSIRRSQLLVRTGHFYMPSISLKGFLVANNYNARVELSTSELRPFEKSVSRLTITDNKNEGKELFDIPVDDRGRILINYAGPKKTFPYVSLASLLDPSEDMLVEHRDIHETDKDIAEKRVIKVNKADFIKNKLFILGATAIGIYDLRVSPFDENFPGAETHVNVLDNLSRRDFLFNHPKEEQNMLIGMLVLGLLVTLALTHLGAVSGLLLTSATVFAVLMADKYLFFLNGIVLSIIFPLFLVIFLYVGLTFYKYFTEERNKKELRSTFSKYVSPAIVDEILQDPSNIELGGRKENITVFFSDVRGFTTISEKLDPRALSDLLNNYLTPMTDLVFKNRGTLDKYMGDAIMAFFGAPIHYSDHAVHACRCALESVEKLKELQLEFEKKGLPKIDLGIGLNTGECSVGNMGSETVRNYTVMGDAVNLASRLEGINKQYGTRIIISEFTYKEVKDHFVCREVDLVRVKGKLLPVKIYELVGENKIEDDTRKLLEHFKSGYSLYHQKSFSDAIACFEKALNINPEDVPAKLYVKRCQNFIANPPPADWDGVFVMTSK